MIYVAWLDRESLWSEYLKGFHFYSVAYLGIGKELSSSAHAVDKVKTKKSHNLQQSNAVMVVSN